jgi:tetratricopeptide (TPR) repeat protein
VLHARSLPPRRAGSYLAGWVAAFLIAACAHPAPTGPAAATRAAIERAEDAELHRDHATARARYQDAIAHAPDGPSQIFARREFASTLEAWGEVPGAIAQLEAIVALDPKHAPSWHDLGILRHAQGDDAGAATALRTAEALAPTDPRPRIALAALLWSQGDRAGAAAEYRVLLGLDLPVRVRTKVEWALHQLEP